MINDKNFPRCVVIGKVFPLFLFWVRGLFGSLWGLLENVRATILVASRQAFPSPALLYFFLNSPLLCSMDGKQDKYLWPLLLIRKIN